MFEALSDRFETIFSGLRGKGKLREEDVDEALREIRRALLEADVNFTVVKNLVGRIRERMVGAEVSQSLNPAQQVIKVVNEELIQSLGGETMRITYASKPPTVVLMAGLQGSQDHQLGQARPLVQGPGPQPAPRRRRPPAPRRRPAAPHAGPADRRARLLRRRRHRRVGHWRPGRGCRGVPRRGPPAGQGRGHRRHRRPARHRRRADGAGAPDLGGHRPALHVPRGRRHDRPAVVRRFR